MLRIPEIAGLWSLPLASEVILLLTLGVIEVAQGAKHGFHYSFECAGANAETSAAETSAAETSACRMTQKETTPTWYPELHWIDRRMMWALYMLLAAAGCDVVRVLLMQSVARPGFQYLIDVGATGEPFTELDEYGEQNPDGSWDRFQKGITGRGRLWLAGVNFILLFYAPLVRLLLDALGLGAIAHFLS